MTDGYKLAGTSLLAVGVVFSAAQILRICGKWLELIVFRKEDHLPTTEALTGESGLLSADSRSKVLAKISALSGLTLTKKNDSDVELRKRVVEAIRVARSKYRDKENLKEYNILYGFVRNLLAGLPAACIGCGIQAYYDPGIRIPLAAAGMGCLVLFSFSKRILRAIGELYAKELFSTILAERDAGRT